MVQDIVDALRTDPGKRTFGELLQERGAALHEILRLRARIKGLTAAVHPGRTEAQAGEERMAVRPGMLIRLAEVTELLGVSRSTIYKWMNDGTFPAPVRVSERAVRWRSEDIEAWRESLVASSG